MITYNKATINWTNSGVAGTIGGTLGTTAVSGSFSLLMRQSEDLVAGTATDQGTIAFANMSPASLDANGKFSGTSFIPNPATRAGAAACALEEQASLILTGTASPCTSDCTPVFALYGLPSIPGTCTSTGYQSIGKFSMSSVSQSHQGGDQSPKDNSQANSNGEGHQGFPINGTFLSSSTAAVAPIHGNSGG